jgi:hypothetical protein
MGMLKEDGILLVRIHDSDRHREYVGAIHHIFPHAAELGEKLLCFAGSRRTRITKSQDSGSL